MKIYVSALLPAIGVVLHIGVSSAMPASSSNQPTSPTRDQGTSRPRNERMYFPIDKDRAVFDKNTGELVAIFHNQKRINICDIVFEERDPNLIPDESWLLRGGRRGLRGQYFENKVYEDYDLHYRGPIIKPQKNDVVEDPTGVTIKGIFGDGGRYFEIVYRKTRAHKWVLP